MIVALAIGTVLTLIYFQQSSSGVPAGPLGDALRTIFLSLLALAAFLAWYFVLAQESRHAAEEETDRQTAMLIDEIEAHTRTDLELQRARDIAEAANLAKSRYIVGVSHEIRSPLNTISGYAQLLERDPGRHAGDAARVIRRSASHLVNLVDGLVDISRIENGLLRIERNRVDLAELLDQTVDMFRLQAAAKGLVFEYERSARLPAHVFTDEKRLRQILINLISNAIKYTSSGSASLHVRWRNPVAEFEVADTGIGIAQEDLERIFEPFERVNGGSGAPGVGLGLTITRLLTQIMGAELLVESRPGAGSLFTVKMFLSEATPPPSHAVAAGQVAGYAGERRRILVTDDDPVHLDMVRDILQPLGFDLVFAGEGAACLASYPRERPDLVMLDIGMPGIDGWETARALRRDHGDEPVILMVSANAHDFQRNRREDDPHDDFLTKPYEIDALLDRLQTLLGLTWTRK
jgi:signal transduction histidine kinase/CheY-like chemotaxis protein